jgi:hypothetical protein
MIACGNRAHSALTAHDHDDGPEGSARTAPGRRYAGLVVTVPSKIA